MTNQEAFDKSLAHLRKQGKRAISADGIQCMYRAPDGSMCAIGCLIPDKLYKRELENNSQKSWNLILKITGLDGDFVSNMQSILHDSLPDNNFLSKLEAAAGELARDWGLSYTKGVA